MRKVAIVGAGSTKFKARWIDKTYYELAFDAAKMAMEDAGIDAKGRSTAPSMGFIMISFSASISPMPLSMTISVWG